MSFNGSPGHLQLACNFSVITTLQKQLDNLLFAWAQPNRLFLHSIPPSSSSFSITSPGFGTRPNLSKCHSIHNAIFRV